MQSLKNGESGERVVVMYVCTIPVTSRAKTISNTQRSRRCRLVGLHDMSVRWNPSVRFDAEMRLKDRSLLRYQIEEANDSTTFASCGHDLLGKIK